jgi:hypothetical protein
MNLSQVQVVPNSIKVEDQTYGLYKEKFSAMTKLTTCFQSYSQRLDFPVCSYWKRKTRKDIQGRTHFLIIISYDSHKAF